MGVASSWRRLAHAWGAALAFLFASGGPASAEQKFAWHESRTNQGCTFYSWTNGGKSHDKGMDYDWDRPCTPGQPINGKGTLSKKIKPGSGLAGRDNFYTGMFVDGVHDGEHQFVSTIQDLRNEDSITFRMGCVPDAESPSGFALGCTPRVKKAANTQSMSRETAKSADLSGKWRKVAVKEGCFFYAWGEPHESEAKTSTHWNGPCQAGNPISGDGVQKSYWAGDIPTLESECRGRYQNGYSVGTWDCFDHGNNAGFKSTFNNGCWINPQTNSTDDCVPAGSSPSTTINLDEDPWAAPVAAAAPTPSPAPANTDNKWARNSPFPENGPLSEEGRIGKPIRNTGWEKDCIKEIKQLQVSSQSWPGTVQEISFKLGTQQKAMFEGKCAGHPEAAAYIAGAENMIAKGSPAVAETAPPSAEQTPPAETEETGLAFLPKPFGNRVAPEPDMSDRQHVIAMDREISKCISVIPNSDPGFGGFINSCNFKIGMVYCLSEYKLDPSPTAFNWGSAFQCEEGHFGSLDAPANGRVGAHTRGSKHVHWAGCKSPEGLQKVEYRNGQLVGICK